MVISFDFQKEYNELFGTIGKPVAEVIFLGKVREFMEYAYVDSGADISLIPKSVGEFLKLSIDKDDPVTELRGLTSSPIPIVIKRVPIRIGNKSFVARFGWALTEDVPLVLGRMDFFDCFDVCFEDNNRTVLIDSYSEGG